MAPCAQNRGGEGAPRVTETKQGTRDKDKTD
jgi:hypothetical protein